MNNKKDNKLVLLLVCVFTAVFSLILSSMIFSSPKHHDLKVPVAPTVTSTFPDIKNDPNYNTFLKDGALDPTQPVQVGKDSNTKPFSQ